MLRKPHRVDRYFTHLLHRLQRIDESLISEWIEYGEFLVTKYADKAAHVGREPSLAAIRTENPRPVFLVGLLATVLVFFITSTVNFSRAKAVPHPEETIKLLEDRLSMQAAAYHRLGAILSNSTQIHTGEDLREIRRAKVYWEDAMQRTKVRLKLYTERGAPCRSGD